MWPLTTIYYLYFSEPFLVFGLLSSCSHMRTPDRNFDSRKLSSTSRNIKLQGAISTYSESYYSMTQHIIYYRIGRNNY